MKNILLFSIIILYSLIGFGNNERINNNSKKRVLVLNSYHEGYHWTDRIMEGIKSEIDKSDNIELFINYMDTKRCFDSIYFKQLADIYSTKYINYKFDAILATDDDALNFLIKYRDSVFSKIPVIFCGISDFSNSSGLQNNLYSGIEESYDIDGTFNLMLDLHPQTQEIAIISDITTTGQIFLDKIQEVAAKIPDSIKITYLTNESLDSLKSKLKKLSEDAIILWSINLREPDGIYLDSKQSIQFIKRNSNLPIYALWDVIGLGAVGGNITSPKHQGEIAATMILAILEGGNIQNMPIVKNPLIYKFDYIELQNHNIDLNQLSQDAEIVNMPFSFYESYYKLIWIIVSIIVFLVGVIFILAVFNRKRKLAERLAVSKNNELKKLSEKLKLNNEELNIAKERAEESDNLKSLFIANLSHELRTPMNGILGFSDLLQQEDIDSSTRIKYVKIIIRSGKRLLNLINDLLNISKIEAKQLELNFEKITVSRIMKEMFDFYLPETIDKSIVLEYSNETKELIIETDKSKLVQVLSNLISNAIKFTSQGRIHFGWNIEGSFVKFYVSDTGIGIHENKFNIIFNRFGQANKSYEDNKDGIGLGLCISKGFIDKLGGEIWLDSKINKGSTFYFTIPIKPL